MTVIKSDSQLNEVVNRLPGVAPGFFERVGQKKIYTNIL